MNKNSGKVNEIERTTRCIGCQKRQIQNHALCYQLERKSLYEILYVTVQVASRRLPAAVYPSVASRRLTTREFGNFMALWMYTEKAIDRTNKRGVTCSSFIDDNFLKNLHNLQKLSRKTKNVQIN